MQPACRLLHPNGAELIIGTAGATMMICPPALMEQEARLIETLSAVSSFEVNDTGALILSTEAGVTLTARRR